MAIEVDECQCKEDSSLCRKHHIISDVQVSEIVVSASVDYTLMATILQCGIHDVILCWKEQCRS